MSIASRRHLHSQSPNRLPRALATRFGSPTRTHQTRLKTLISKDLSASIPTRSFPLARSHCRCHFEESICLEGWKEWVTAAKQTPLPKPDELSKPNPTTSLPLPLPLTLSPWRSSHSMNSLFRFDAELPVTTSRRKLASSSNTCEPFFPRARKEKRDGARSMSKSFQTI